MNTWITVWAKTAKTIDHCKNTHWIDRAGLVPYFFLGLNSAIESNLPALLYSETEVIKPQDKLLASVIILVAGILMGLIFRLVWVNMIFLFGKIMKGNANKKEIDTVLSLSFIPEIFKLLYAAGIVLFNQGDWTDVTVNNLVVIICYLLTIRIMILGISRVQRFSYGQAIVNIFTPQLVIVVLFLLIRGLQPNP